MDDIIQQFKSKLPDNILEDFRKEATARKLNKKDAEKVLEYLSNQYEHAKITPGEAIGIVTAESFGEPGTQMSCRADEKIIVKIRNKIKIKKIGKFVDSVIEARGSFALNEDSEIAPLHELEVYVPSLNKDEKIEWKRVIECSRHRAPQKLVTIRTTSGRSITCTDNHSFVTRINNAVVPINGKNLKAGDRIPVINSFLTDSPPTTISIHEKIAGFGFVDDDGRLHGQSEHVKPIKNTLKLNSLTGWFTGAYLAEGCAIGNSRVGISNINDDYMDNAKKFLHGAGLGYTEDFHHRGFAESRDLSVNSTLLTTFIDLSCGRGSDHKRVPEFAYSAPDAFVAGLLRGYFDGDGNFHVSKKMISASSNSKELIDGVALLLSRFRIFSYKIEDREGQHWLLIPYKYAPQFLSHIGSDIDYKREALEQLAELAKGFWNSRSQDYTDIIPGFGDLFHRTARKLGYPTRYVNNFTKRQKIGRTALYRYMKHFEYLAEKKNIDVSSELEIMRRMFYSDVIWDEIASIDYVDYDHSYVYDLSVPGLETFTTSEGIVTHNTLNVFHFAGVAEVSVTQGLPRLIEILDARKEISTPSMEIFLKTPYNKDPEEVKRVAALIKETKLSEFVKEFSINLTKMHIELLLNKQKLSEVHLSKDKLAAKIMEHMKAVKATVDEDRIILKLKSAENEMMETYKLKEKVKDLYISGVKDIHYVLPVKQQSEFVIVTSGSNLEDVLKVKEVDTERTTTNSVFEVLDVLGVEAARQAIINEAIKVIEDQGLDIDVRHIMFVADVMTSSGTVKGITRSGITGEKRSVLARASFETPLKHIINASLIGEEDELNSVIENVMLNQPVPVGTGLPGLVTKVKKDVTEKKDEA